MKTRSLEELNKYTEFSGFKNIIIKGGFDVWQRGTSFAYSAGTSGYHTADRRLSQNTTDGQFTMSKSEINGSNAVKFNVDTAVTDLTVSKYWYGTNYMFEGQDLYSIAKQGKTVTLSFWFNSNVVGEYPVGFRNRTNNLTNWESYVTTFNYTTANVPQKVEVQIPLNHAFNPALLNDNNLGMDITIGFLNQGVFVTSTVNAWQTGSYLTTPTCVNWGATAGNFIEIAEMQLEEGSVATPFEQRPYGLELSLCQRYYETTNAGVSNPNAGTFTWMLSQFVFDLRYFRTTPAITHIITTAIGAKPDIKHNTIYYTVSNFGLAPGAYYYFTIHADAEL